MKKVIIIFGVVVILAILYIVYLFIPNNKVIVAYSGQVTQLVIGGKIVESPDPPVIENEQVLLPIDAIKKYFDETIYWDEKKKKVIITTKNKVIKMNTDKSTAYVNNKPIELNLTAKVIADVVYLPMEDFLKDIFKIDVVYDKKNNVVVIDYSENVKWTGEVIVKNVEIRKDMSIKAPIVKKVKEGDKLWLFEEYERWYKVRSEDGILGYIKKEYLKKIAVTSSVYTEEETNSLNRLLKGKLNLVWHYIYNKTPDMSKEPKIEGLDIISPTWFELEGTEGDVVNKADLNYVKWAKRNGYQVWALFSNHFESDGGKRKLTLKDKRDMTSQILNDSEMREKVIKRVLVYTKLYKLDGINIDFENMYKKDKDMFSQFIRELAPLLREEGVVVSVDVGVPDGSEEYSLCYDRKALAKAVDYVMVMAYDQHYATDRVSGSVAQYSWVEKKIKRTLEEVPASKLILGLPLYTREWEEEVDNDGKMIGKPKSKVYSMDNIRKEINKNNAKVQWDENSGQFYAEYRKENRVYKIWLEEETSINLKSSLVHKYGLAGAASWKKGFETSETWAVLNSNLKKNLNYLEWAQHNNSMKYKYE